MSKMTQPTKEQVRTWMQERQTQRAPLPSTEDIRRALGWGLIPKSNDHRTL